MKCVEKYGTKVEYGYTSLCDIDGNCTKCAPGEED